MPNALSSEPINGRHKLEKMIEELEPACEREISGSHFFASGYLLALHDIGLLTEKEWPLLGHLIDLKRQAPNEAAVFNEVGG